MQRRVTTEEIPPATSPGLRWGLFVRSFLLQAVWNPRGMQSLGFFFALSPLARNLDETTRRRFIERHTAFFNTNPVLAPYIIGAVARTELAGRGTEDSEDIKRALSGVLGMAGDALMWRAVRPAAALVGAAVALYGLRTGLWNAWVGPLVMLLCYNVPHIALRLRGISRGLARGPEAASELLGRGFAHAVRGARWVAAFAAGFVLALAALRPAIGGPAVAVVMGAFLVLGAVATRVGIPATLVALAGAAGGVILMLLGLDGG